MRCRPSRSTVLVVTLAVIVVGSCTSATEPPSAASVQLAPGTVTLDAIGATQTAVATVLDQRGAPMTSPEIVWSSSATSVATVSTAGVITAAGNGAATISAVVGAKTALVQVTVAQAPLAPVVFSGNSQSGLISQPLANALRVRIEDRLGGAIAGRQVTFAVTSGGGSITVTTVTSDASGLASTNWTIGSSTSAFQAVSAVVAGNAGVSLFTATALAGPPVQMIVAPGNTANGQVAKFSTAVLINPAVKLLDALGNGVAGATVTWSVLGGGGSLTGASATTNGTGIATVGSWTMGAALGTNTIQASSGLFTPIVFTATSILDPCSAAGATPIAVGATQSSTISALDCVAPGGQNFEQYRLDLSASTSLIMEMNTTLAASVLDPWLEIRDFSTLVIIAENDDVVSGVIQNSRIAITLPAGSYLLRARTYDPGQGGAYTLVVRSAQLGVPTTVVVNAGNGQVAAPNGTTAVAPSVKVTDEADQPVAGVTVTFATVPGHGSATGLSAVTNGSGIATVGSWTLAGGANALSATVSGFSPVGNPVVFSATGKASTAGFDIGLRFVAMPTAGQLQTFSAAAVRWETVLTGDIPNVPLNLSATAAAGCGSPSAINETVDDVIIVVRLEYIDGEYNVLGSAGPCVVRSSPSFIPALGTMRFDTADLTRLEAEGSFSAVILHEMGHVLGVGTTWSSKGFLVNPSTATTSNDTYFSGPLAMAAFNTIGGSSYTLGQRVPVENRRDTTVNGVPRSYAGTRNSHWRETVLLSELMTGFLNSGANPLSLLTIAQMEDLGYTVNRSVADAFAITPSLMADGPGGAGGSPPIDLRNDIRVGPIFMVDRLGRVLGAPPAPPVVRKVPKRLR